MVRMELMTRPRATALATKFVCSKIFCTFSLVSGFTWSGLLMTRETVAIETPARSAMSFIRILTHPNLHSENAYIYRPPDVPTGFAQEIRKPVRASDLLPDSRTRQQNHSPAGLLQGNPQKLLEVAEEEPFHILPDGLLRNLPAGGRQVLIFLR